MLPQEDRPVSKEKELFQKAVSQERVELSARVKSLRNACPSNRVPPPSSGDSGQAWPASEKTEALGHTEALIPVTFVTS